MTKIIAIGGKKKSGKGLAATYLSGLVLSSRNAIKDFKLNSENDDHSIDVIGSLNTGKNIHINDIDPKIIKIYGFADKLKDICSSVFNIDSSLMCGSEEKKNSETHLRWKDMPGVITNKGLYDKLMSWESRNQRKIGKNKFGSLPNSIIYKPDEHITVRELLQFFGTDVCRKLYSDCWVSALSAQIKKDHPEFAIVADTRFDNEFYGLKNCAEFEKLMIKLLRDPNNNGDTHASEQGFSDDLPWDIVIDNRTNTPPEMCNYLIKRIAETNFLKPND